MLHRPALFALPLLLSLLLLPGCGDQTPHMVAAAPPAPPASLFQCSPQPNPPDAPFDDKGLAYWIVDLADAGQDCRDHLRAAQEAWPGGATVPIAP
jgi:hypothetical protein